MSLGNLFVVSPKKSGSAREAEMAAQLGIGGDAQQFFDVALRKFHDGRKSRPLDFGLSSAQDRFPATVSKHMDTMGQRLRFALTEREMKPKDLIKATRLSRATIYFVLGGPTKPEKITANTVEKICRALRIRREWLLKGEPPMDSDIGKAQPKSTPAATVPDVHELHVAVSLTAKALAASIRPAGQALLDSLEESGEPLTEGSFLGELAKAIRAEVGPAAGERPASPAKPSKARR